MFIQSKKAGSPRRVPSGRTRAFYLDDDGARTGEELAAQRAGPQRRHIHHEQPLGSSRPYTDTTGPDRRHSGRHLTKRCGRNVEQLGAGDDVRS